MESIPYDFMKDPFKKSPWQNDLRFSHFSKKKKFEGSLLNNFFSDRPSLCHNVFTYV